MNLCNYCEKTILYNLDKKFNSDLQMKLSFIKTTIIFSMIFFGLGMTVLSAEGNSDILPIWLKNSASWWSEDQISETEYIASLQYLIDEEIIQAYLQ